MKENATYWYTQKEGNIDKYYNPFFCVVIVNLPDNRLAMDYNVSGGEIWSWAGFNRRIDSGIGKWRHM